MAGWSMGIMGTKDTWYKDLLQGIDLIGAWIFFFFLEGLFLIWIYFKKMNRLKEALNYFCI